MGSRLDTTEGFLGYRIGMGDMSVSVGGLIAAAFTLTMVFLLSRVIHRAFQRYAESRRSVCRWRSSEARPGSTWGGAGLLIVVVAFAFQPLLQYVPEPILEHWAGDRLVWDPEVLAVLALELLFGLGAILVAFALLRRKRSLV